MHIKQHEKLHHVLQVAACGLRRWRRSLKDSEQSCGR